MTIRFDSKTTEWAWLSNFSPHAIELDGLRWPTVEHYYQAQKQAEPARVEQVRRAESARRAMKMGRDRSAPRRSDWDTVKVRVMDRALRAKFDQHPALARRLAATADRELIHASNHDRFWGRDDQGVGENRLGLLLMDIRRSRGTT